jgi:hypothetical protein
VKFGKRRHPQRYQFTPCRKVFTDARDNTLEGKYLPLGKAGQILQLVLAARSHAHRSPVAMTLNT